MTKDEGKALALYERAIAASPTASRPISAPAGPPRRSAATPRRSGIWTGPNSWRAPTTRSSPGASICCGWRANGRRRAPSSKPRSRPAGAISCSGISLRRCSLSWATLPLSKKLLVDPLPGRRSTSRACTSCAATSPRRNGISRAPPPSIGSRLSRKSVGRDVCAGARPRPSADVRRRSRAPGPDPGDQAQRIAAGPGRRIAEPLAKLSRPDPERIRARSRYRAAASRRGCVAFGPAAGRP